MKLNFLLYFLMSSFCLGAQNYVFNRTYDQNNLFDHMIGVYETDSCYYAVRIQNGYEAEDRQISLSRLDKNGDILSTKELFRTYDGFSYGTSHQTLFPVTKDILMVHGHYREHPDSSSNIFIHTFKDTGDSLQFRIYPKAGNQRLEEILRLPDQSYIACGVHDGTDMYVVKFDRFRNKVWDRVYPEEHLQIAYSISPTQDGGYFIVGRSHQYVEHYEIKAFKIDSVGNLEWTKTFGGGNNGIVHHGLALSDGNYLVAGSLENDFGGYSSYLVKFNESGEIIWEYHDFRNDTNRFRTNILELDDGSLIIGGERRLFGTPSARLSKFSPNGELIWESYHTGRNASPLLFYGIQQAQDGGYLLHGSTFGPDPITIQDAWLVKTDSEGYCCDEVDCLEFLSQNAFLDQNIKIEIFPNPVIDELYISTILPPEYTGKSSPRMKILNTSGQLIFYSDEPQNEWQVNVQNWPSGLYIIQIYNQTQLIASKKLIVH